MRKSFWSLGCAEPAVDQRDDKGGHFIRRLKLDEEMRQ